MVLKIKKETWGKCGIKTISIVIKKKILNCGKKWMDKEEKQKYKAFFKGETGIFIIEKLTCDIIECCKLPESIEFRKNLEYNHNEYNGLRRKILLLIKNSISENQIFGLKIILLLKLIKEIMKIMI